MFDGKAWWRAPRRRQYGETIGDAISIADDYEVGLFCRETSSAPRCVSLSREPDSRRRSRPRLGQHLLTHSCLASPSHQRLIRIRPRAAVSRYLVLWDSNPCQPVARVGEQLIL